MAEARSFFENDVAPLTSRNSQNNIGNKTPLWQQAAMVTTSLGNAIAVPIRYQNPIALQAEGEKTLTELQKTSYLLIYKDNNQNMQAEWVSLAPMGEKKNGKFTGIVDIRAWDGEFKRGYAFGQNGQVASVSLNSMVIKQISTAREKECYTIAKWGGVGVEGHLVWKIIGYDTYCIEIHDPRNNLDQSVEQEGDDFGGGTGDGPSPEDYTEILDCAGVPGGTAKFSEECKKCIGGTTGIEKCPTKNPCDEVKSINQKTQNQQIKDATKALSKKPSDKEYGYEDKLVSLGGDKYKEPNIRSNGKHSFNINFTWNDTDGYTIGFNHKHTIGTAPSPGDVMSPFTFAYNPVLIRSGQQQFYKDNLTVTTLTDGNVYQITIADWDAIKDIYDKNSIDELNKEYQRLGEMYADANNGGTSAMQNSEYALMKLFGSAINLYKREEGAVNFVPYTINKYDNIAKNPCK